MTRIVRHSLTAAWKVVQTPRLLSVILENFLPHNLSPLLTGENVSSMSSVYGVPLKQALHLLRVKANFQCSSQNINLYLVEYCYFSEFFCGMSFYSVIVYRLIDFIQINFLTEIYIYYRSWQQEVVSWQQSWSIHMM